MIRRRGPSLLPLLSLLLLLVATTTSAFVVPGPQRPRPTPLQATYSRSEPQPKKTKAFNAAAKDVGAPAVVLVRPYLDENIGSCARAMLNFGLTDLRIINPFCDHLTPMARARASGADDILEQATLYKDVGAAVADLAEVIGTSARQRDMTVKIVSPEEAARLAVGSLEAFAQGGARAGYMFGSERNGLTNDDLVYATKQLQIPTNPAFSSLNLGQAVQICGYEYWKARARVGDQVYNYKETSVGLAKGTRVATAGEVEGLWGRLQEVLDLTELNPDEHVRKGLYDRFKSWLLRSSPDVRDVNAFHGAITTVVTKHENLDDLKKRLIEANARNGRTTPRRERKAATGSATAIGEEEMEWRKKQDRERAAAAEEGAEGWQDEEQAKQRGRGW